MDCIISPLPAGEQYATVADLIAVDDRPQATVTIPRWQKDGRALKLLVRALSLEQQEAIHRAARKKDSLTGNVTTDRTIFVAETLRYACVLPQLDAPQAKALASKNAVVLEAIVDFIWGILSKLDHEKVAALVRDSADLDDELDDELENNGDDDDSDTDRGDDESVA